MGRLFDYVVFPLLLPLVLAWLLLARALSLLSPFLDIYRQRGPVNGALLRLGFEVNYCINTVRRFLTLPLRPYTPDFYIVGFPTNGAMGRGTTSSKLLYRSYFPTVLTRWWKERVLRVGKWMCFDACPLPACLPFTAKRMAKLTPNAKLIFMLRDPVSGAFSAEIMFRNLGMPLNWSLMEDVQASDPRFFETPDQERYWKQVEQLDVDEPLPEDLMRTFYYSCGSILRCGKYADRIAPFLEHFPRENIMFIDFQEFTLNTEAVLQQVFQFVGADGALYKHKDLPPGMQGERRGRRMHPSVKRKLQQYYQESNYRLYALLGRDFNWCDPESRAAAAAAGPAAVTAKIAAAAAAPPSYEVAVEMPALLAAESSSASTSSSATSSSSSSHEAEERAASGAKASLAQAAKDALRLVAESAKGNTGSSDAGKGLVLGRASSEGSLDGGIKAVPALV
ncbi:hypothetical protein N2152v2_010423 [Parachlorella kessleri]